MSFYTRLAMRMFYSHTNSVAPYFSDLKSDMKKAKMKYSIPEYLSLALLTSLLVFLFELPLLSFIFGLVLQIFLFSFISAFTVSIFATIGLFMFFVNYPKYIIMERAKKIDESLPFASIYMATLAGSQLPLNKQFSIFSKFSEYKEVNEEINEINQDVQLFGLDINTALERAVERTPSKNLKEILWGMLSVTRSGGDLEVFLNEKAKTFLNENRRKIYEFSHQLTVYIEIYLTAIVLGAIFFTILTAITSGISGSGASVLPVQALVIFVFLPVISFIFIGLIKSATPGDE